jgi:hypothetical protein
MPTPYTSLDPRIEALKAKSELAETLSVRVNGSDYETWTRLREEHPDLSASDLLKEGIRLRRLADIAVADGLGLFMRRRDTGQLDEVLELLGFSRANPVTQVAAAVKLVGKDRPAASKAPTTKPRKTGASTAPKGEKSKSVSAQQRMSAVP